MQRPQEHQARAVVNADSAVVTRGREFHAHSRRLSGDQADASDNESINRVEGGTKTEKLRALTSKTKAKAKKLLKIGNEESTGEGSEIENYDVIRNIERDPAFSQNQRHKQKRWNDGGTAHNPLGTLESVAATIIHPKKAIKSKVTRTTAGQLSKAERPYISKEADMKFLEAHDNLHHAESSRFSKPVTSYNEGGNVTIGQREKVKEMREHRESLRAAWTTSRHVRRVRVVPKRHIEFPDNDFFVRKDSEGEHFDWQSWLGYVQLHFPKISKGPLTSQQTIIYSTQDFCAQYVDDYDKLPYDISSLRLHIERLIMASAPWQSWAMDVRAIYRWEDPKTTGKWLAIYTILWYTDHIVGFVVSNSNFAQPTLIKPTTSGPLSFILSSRTVFTLLRSNLCGSPCKEHLIVGALLRDLENLSTNMDVNIGLSLSWKT